MKHIILLLLLTSGVAYSRTIKKKAVPSFDTMKNTTACNKIKDKYNTLKHLAFDKASYGIGELYESANVEKCWNRSSQCLDDSYRLGRLYKRLYKLLSFYPRANTYKDSTDYQNWSPMDKIQHEDKLNQTWIDFRKVEKSFRKSCK